MTDYLVDNSAWGKFASGDPVIAARLRQIERSPADLFVTCPPQVLEFCHSAPNVIEHDHYRAQITLGFPLERHPDEGLVLDIQRALWAGGLFRAAGGTDILIAAYAILNDAIVIACDHDFEHIASVTSLQQEYIRPLT